MAFKNEMKGQRFALTLFYFNALFQDILQNEMNNLHFYGIIFMRWLIAKYKRLIK